MRITLTILTPSVQALQDLLDICVKFAVEFLMPKYNVYQDLGEGEPPTVGIKLNCTTVARKEGQILG